MSHLKDKAKLWVYLIWLPMCSRSWRISFRNPKFLTITDDTDTQILFVGDMRKSLDHSTRVKWEGRWRHCEGRWRQKGRFEGSGKAGEGGQLADPAFKASWRQAEGIGGAFKAGWRHAKASAAPPRQAEGIGGAFKAGWRQAKAPSVEGRLKAGWRHAKASVAPPRQAEGRLKASAVPSRQAEGRLKLPAMRADWRQCVWR